MDKQLAEVTITALANSEQSSGRPPVLCCLGVNPRDAAKSRPFFKTLSRHPELRKSALAVNGPTPRNVIKATCDGIFLDILGNILIKAFDAVVEVTKILRQTIKKCAEKFTQSVFSILKPLW